MRDQDTQLCVFFPATSAAQLPLMGEQTNGFNPSHDLGGKSSQEK